jgi:hypothetical protein
LGGIFDRWEYLVAGQPLAEVNAADYDLKPGQVIVTPPAWLPISTLAKGAKPGKQAKDDLRRGFGAPGNRPSYTADSAKREAHLSQAVRVFAHLQANYDLARARNALEQSPHLSRLEQP